MKFMFDSPIIFNDVNIKCEPVVVDVKSVYCLNGKYQLTHIESGKSLVLNTNEFNWVYNQGEYIYCFEDKESRTLVMDTRTHKYVYWNFVANPWKQDYATHLEDTLFFVNDNDSFYIALIKIKEGKILNKIYIKNQLKKLLIKGKKIIVVVQKGNEFLECHSTDGNLCWEVDLQKLHSPSDTRQTGNLLLNDGKLYIVLASTIEKKHTTYVIDEMTGKVLYRFENLAGSYHILNDILYKANRYSVDRIDTRTNALIRDDFEDILKPEKLWIHDDTSILTEDGLLYFYDGATIGGNRIGVLDLKSHKLLWQTKLKIKSRYKSIRSMQLHEDVLYVHADDDTLHVFEKK